MPERSGASEPMSRTSVRSIDGLLEELAATRERGFAIDNGQTREGAYCCGAPVFDGSGLRTAVAGVAVALLAIDVNEESTAEAGKAPERRRQAFPPAGCQPFPPGRLRRAGGE